MEFVFSFERTVVVVAMKYIVGLQCGGCYNEVGTGLVEGYGIERSEYAYVGHNGCVVVVPAVALGRYIDYETDMEMGLVLEYGLGIFGYFVVEAFGGVVGSGYGCVVLTHGYTLSASYTACVVDNGFAIDERECTVWAIAHAHTATYAFVFFDARL